MSFAYFDRRRVIVHAEKDKEIPSGMNKQQGDKDKAMCRILVFSSYSFFNWRPGASEAPSENR
jgi:hypothetical protein